jgi:hypothetical protein
MPAGSQVRLNATACSAKEVRRWDVRMFAQSASAESWPPRLTYGSQIGGVDRDQRVEIPAQDVDCRLEASASRRVDGFWDAEPSRVTGETPTVLELGFGASTSPAADDRSILLSFRFRAAQPS